MENVETGGTTSEFIDGIAGKDGACGKTVDISDCEEDRRIATKVPGVVPMELEKLPNSRHSDGSLYRATRNDYKQYYRVADRNESK
jgi:hypothetical protein